MPIVQWSISRWPIIKKTLEWANYVLLLSISGKGLCLFKWLHLLFLQKFPGGTFIQGATSILDSRVDT